MTHLLRNVPFEVKFSRPTKTEATVDCGGTFPLCFLMFQSQMFQFFFCGRPYREIITVICLFPPTVLKFRKQLFFRGTKPHSQISQLRDFGSINPTTKPTIMLSTLKMNVTLCLRLCSLRFLVLAFLFGGMAFRPDDIGARLVRHYIILHARAFSYKLKAFFTSAPLVFLFIFIHFSALLFAFMTTCQCYEIH